MLHSDMTDKGQGQPSNERSQAWLTAAIWPSCRDRNSTLNTVLRAKHICSQTRCWSQTKDDDMSCIRTRAFLSTEKLGQMYQREIDSCVTDIEVLNGIWVRELPTVFVFYTFGSNNIEVGY